MAKASLSPTSGLMTFGFSDGFGDRRRADMTKPLKKILNPREVAAYYELQRVATEYGYGVHIKMRLADVFPVEKSGIAAELYTFALRSHFDFVVSGEAHDPLFAVEFDGPSHRDDQRKRDAKKNELCKIFSFPLLRINTRHLVQKYNKASLLRWIISAWELQKAFCEAQNKGQMPLDARRKYGRRGTPPLDRAQASPSFEETSGTRPYPGGIHVRLYLLGRWQ